MKIKDKIRLILFKSIKKNENSVSKWIIKCPANKFALIRTLKVIGRIKILIISIITIKGLSKKGHPDGVKWIKKFIGLNNENNKHENHIINLKKKNKLIWEFKQKEYETKSFKLIVILKINVIIKSSIEILELLILLKSFLIKFKMKFLKYKILEILKFINEKFKIIILIKKNEIGIKLIGLKEEKIIIKIY